MDLVGLDRLDQFLELVRLAAEPDFYEMPWKVPSYLTGGTVRYRQQRPPATAGARDFARYASLACAGNST